MEYFFECGLEKVVLDTWTSPLHCIVKLKMLYSTSGLLLLTVNQVVYEQLLNYSSSLSC